MVANRNTGGHAPVYRRRLFSGSSPERGPIRVKHGYVTSPSELFSYRESRGLSRYRRIVLSRKTAHDEIQTTRIYLREFIYL